MKKSLIISFLVVITFVIAFIYLFPVKTWQMQLHRNIFQDEAYVNNQVAVFKPFQVMLQDLYFSDTTSWRIDSVSLLLSSRIDNEISYDYWLIPIDQTIVFDGYSLSVQKINYNHYRNTLLCIIAIKKRCWRWSDH